MIDFPIIDSHIHLLDQKRFGYAWADGAPALKRDWTPNDLRHAAKPYEIEGLVFVEVDVDMPQYLDEAEWVDGLARARPPRDGRRRLPAARAGSGNRARDGADREAQDGARRAPPDPEPARPRVRAAAGLSRGDPSAAEIQPFLRSLHLASADAEHADHDAAAVRKCPSSSITSASPGSRPASSTRGERTLREMAALPNVVCKLSGLTTEADHKTWTRDQLRPYIDHVIECFGPDRILYGGDWPVSELAGSYLQWLATLDWSTAGFSPPTSASSSATTRSNLSTWRLMNASAIALHDRPQTQSASLRRPVRGGDRHRRISWASTARGCGTTQRRAPPIR